MTTFEYQSVSGPGGNSSGTIEATNRADAVRQLRRRGEVATRVVQMGGGGAVSVRPAARFKKSTTRSAVKKNVSDRAPGSGNNAGLFASRSMNRADFATFINEIATALEAGLPLMACLRAISSQAASPQQAEIVDHLMDRIEAGRSFAQAAAEWGTPFDDMALGMLKAGEATGQLDQVMLQLADLLDRDGELRRAVKGAMIYPLVLLVILAGGIFVIVNFTIPNILSVVEDQGVQLPWPTRVVQGVADFSGQYWWAVAGGFTAIFLTYRWAMQQPHIKLAWHGIMLRIPVLGRLLRDVAVGRFTRTMGTMLGAGIGVLESLSITSDTLGNKAMEAVLDDVADEVRSGKSLADPMDECGFFPPLLIQVVNLGERSGKLDAMLLHASEAFDRKTQASIKLFTTLLPPAVLVLMAGVILFVMLAAMLPMLEMQANIG